MSFISAGIAGAGLLAQLAGPLLGKKQAPMPQFDPGVDNRFGPNGVTGKERTRQADYQKQVDAITARQLGRFDDTQGQMASKSKSLADFFATNSSPLPVSGPTADAMPAPRNAMTTADTDSKLARVGAFNTQQNGALAKLRSFGDVFADADRGLQGDRSQLANVENFRGGSSALLPFEMQANYRPPSYGNTPPPPDNSFSDILMGVGKAATGAGLSGFNPFGGGGFAGTPAGLAQYGSPGYAGSSFFGGPR